jgi:hypothetical protein
MAAAALEGLHCQAAQGGTQFRRLSLARTAAWLMDGARPEHPHESSAGAQTVDIDRWLVEIESAAGAVQAVGPPGRLGNQALRWPPVVSRYGADEAVWLPR